MRRSPARIPFFIWSTSEAPTASSSTRRRSGSCRAKRYALKTGDRIIIDPYEIEVSISAAHTDEAGPGFDAHPDLRSREPGRGYDPFGGVDPFAPPDDRTPAPIQPAHAWARSTPAGQVVPSEEVDIHPEELYEACVMAAAELATFTTTSKRPPMFPGYRHRLLRESFEPVITSPRASLSVLLEQAAISIPLEAKKFGISVAMVPDRTLYSSAVFTLAARADVAAEELRRRFPSQLKIGPVERIRDLVTLQLPGVPVAALPVAPRQIPFSCRIRLFRAGSTQECKCRIVLTHEGVTAPCRDHAK